MKNLKPLVTENPEGNYRNLHNMTGIDANKEVYLRDLGGEGDINLVDYCKHECKVKCDIEQEGTAEDFAENMDCDCPVTLIYHMAVGHAELRNRLGKYESYESEVCTWEEDDGGMWSCSKCEMAFNFNDGGPNDNDVHYCPQCGREIANVSSYGEDGEG